MHPKKISKKESFLVEEIKKSRKRIIRLWGNVLLAEDEIRKGSVILDWAKDRSWDDRINDLKVKLNKQYHELLSMESQTRLPYSTQRDLMFIAKESLIKIRSGKKTLPARQELVALRDNVSEAIILANRLESVIETKQRKHDLKGLVPSDLKEELAPFKDKLQVQLEIIENNTDSFTQIVGTVTTVEFNEVAKLVSKSEKIQAKTRTLQRDNRHIVRKHKSEIDDIRKSMIAEMKQSFANASSIALTDLIESMANNSGENTQTTLSLMGDFNDRVASIVEQMNMPQS